MSRRRPDRVDDEYLVPQATARSGARRGRADQLASKIEPFFASGGMSYWVTHSDFNAVNDGVQLLCTLYVPAGRMGFIKEIRVAPHCPSVLCDPWTSGGAANGNGSWREWNRNDRVGDVDHPKMGDVWRAPYGWEAAWDDESTVLPTWTWWLRYQPGNYQQLRAQQQNIPPFDPTDPSSWFMVPNIPVPASAYSGGIPGNPAGPQWDSQRLQVLPGDKMNLHIPIPQDMTVMLFARWTQSDVAPMGMDASGLIALTSATEYNSGRVAPIGPSMGSLLGYTQSLDASATAHNVEEGWGG